MQFVDEHAQGVKRVTCFNDVARANAHVPFVKLSTNYGELLLRKAVVVVRI